MERLQDDLTQALQRFIDGITEPLETILQEIIEGNYENAEYDLKDLLGRL